MVAGAWLVETVFIKAKAFAFSQMKIKTGIAVKLLR
jgi:hypothetical protein